MTGSLPAYRSIRRHILIGVSICAVMIFGVGGWAATVDLAGAVVGSGVLVVESNVKNVQHPQGGVVGELRVKDGEVVRAGDVVVRLDDTQIRANLAIITGTLDEISARMARLTAEQSGSETVSFPADLLDRRDDPQVAEILSGEQHLFEHRRDAREGQKAQLRERIVQYEEEIKGLKGQVEAKAREIELIGQELDGLKDLFDRQLVSQMRLKALERQDAQINGERGHLIANIAQAKGKIAESELQIIQIDQDLRSEVTREMSDLRAKAIELRESKIAAEDDLARIDIRAPTDGRVHQLAFHTVGGVIRAGESIMLIVPNDDLLIVEAKVATTDIDQLEVGQEAILRFSAFSQATTPELAGAVSRISPDMSVDDRTGATFYKVNIALPKDELSRLGSVKLVPGMPVEAFIQTAPRTALSYLTKPLVDQASRAFLEE